MKGEDMKAGVRIRMMGIYTMASHSKIMRNIMIHAHKHHCELHKYKKAPNNSAYEKKYLYGTITTHIYPSCYMYNPRIPLLVLH